MRRSKKARGAMTLKAISQAPNIIRNPIIQSDPRGDGYVFSWLFKLVLTKGKIHGHHSEDREYTEMTRSSTPGAGHCSRQGF